MHYLVWALLIFFGAPTLLYLLAKFGTAGYIRAWRNDQEEFNKNKNQSK